MLSIVYSSAASHRFTRAELDALLAQSREHNARSGLTGLLVHRDGRFLQLIEGQDADVEERMRVIEGDSRHDHIRVLLEEEIEARRFPEWTMGFETGDSAATDPPGFRRTFDDIDGDRTTSGSLPALRALIAWFRVQHDAAGRTTP